MTGPLPPKSLGALLAIAMVGCAAAPVAPKAPEEKTKVVKAGNARITTGNQGRLLGTIVADAAALEWAGVSSLEGAQAQAYDQDGKPISQIAKVDVNGNFVLSDLKDSRAIIYVEADVNGLRFRTLTAAPRERRDYGTQLDAASTFLADKLHRSALDQELFLDKLQEAQVDATEDLVNAYMNQEDKRDVLEQDERDLNAYAFDHFMDDHLAVKVAVYAIGPSILRGWKPNGPLAAAPTAKPTATPSPQPTPTVDPNSIPTPVPSSTAPPPK